MQELPKVPTNDPPKSKRVTAGSKKARTACFNIPKCQGRMLEKCAPFWTLFLVLSGLIFTQVLRGSVTVVL